MEALMMTDPDGRRRVELASQTITKHIVGITGDIAEEEDTNKRRREEKMDDATAENPAANQPEEVLPSVRAAMGGKDATTPANAAASTATRSSAGPALIIASLRVG